MKKYKYNYKTVNIPSDCETDPDQREQLAFLNVEELMTTYDNPALWYVVKDDGENVTVCRKSNK